MIFITYNNHRYIKKKKFCRRLCIKHVYFCAFFLVFLHLLLLLLSPFIYKFLLLPVLPVGGVVCNLHFYCSCLVIPYCLLVVRAFLQTHLTGCICLACKMCLLLSILLLLLLSWSLFFYMYHFTATRIFLPWLDSNAGFRCLIFKDDAWPRLKNCSSVIGAKIVCMCVTGDTAACRM